MRSTIFLVTALVAASTATPWGSRANKQCAAYCRETSKFNYNVGTVYSYEYTGEVASKVGGTSEEESRVHISAQAEFEVVSSCELVLRLKQVRLEESQPDDVTIRRQSKGSKEFSSALEQHPLLFAFQDGQIEHLCPSVDEQAWILNVKRGILSALQNSMKDVAVSQLVHETDVVGHCEANYTVTGHGRNGVTVSRTKDLLACTGRNNQHSSPIQSTPYSSASSIQSLPLLKSDIECLQTISNQRLEKSVCIETHLFRPFSNGQSGASTRITQSLTYSQERRSDEIPTDYKRKRANLLFDEPEKTSSSASLSLVDETLMELSKHSQIGASPQIPSLFSRLVSSLRPLTYRQLSEIFAKNVHPNAKKFLLDAAPLVGTAASYGLMKDIIQEGLLSNLEADMWLSSLAFQPKPTIEMITVVAPLLAETSSVRPKALLSISAMIHTYCRTHANCETEESIRQAIKHIENHIGIACSGDEQNVLLALKALGNAGLIVSSAETLKRCYQDAKHSMVIRLAAIEALRRVPCHMVDRSSLLSLYQDMTQDSELRIAAYLAVMQCPTQQLLEQVKQMMIREEVNQVGSFVWTHLTNLQETSSPGKQAIRQMIQSDFLRNKFSTDARKFSRNVEASAFWKELNLGGSVESNIIFSSRSYLPRSASLNLTLDLFGQSVNLFELGARVEGFESLVESFFGPGGFYPDDTIQKVLESLRSKRSAPIDQQSLNQLSTIFDAKGQLADHPQGDLYLRIFGNELHTHHFNGLGQLGRSQSALSMLLQAARQKDIDFTKSVSMMDVAFVVPTAIGLPLSLKVNATATINFRMGGTFQVEGTKDIRILGHIKPSGTMEVNGVMSVDLWTLAKSGVLVQNALHTSSGLSGKLVIQGSKLVSIQLDPPQAASHVFSYDSRLFLLQQDGERALQPAKRSPISQKSCSPSELSRYFGVELCGEIEFWPRTSTGPSSVLTGPTHASVFIRKTDTHAAYQFDFQRDGMRSISLIMDTPNSQVNRRIAAQLLLDETAKTLRASFACPQKSAELTGKYEYNPMVKSADVMLSLDGNEVASIRAALRTDLKGSSGRYEPSLVITQRRGEVFNFQGYYNYVTSSKYGLDFQLKHLTVRPIRLTGDITKDNDKYDVSIGVKSYLLDTTMSGTFRVLDKLITAKTKIDYSLLEGTTQNLEMSTKYSRVTKGALKKTIWSGIIQSSQFPQYNGDMTWELQRSGDYMENNLKINSGGNQWEFQQLYSIQLRDAKIRLAVSCPQQKVDWLLLTGFQTTDSTLSSQSVLRLSPGRQWSGKVDLVRQYQPARYGGKLEISSPTTSRQLKAEVSQQEKQWDLIVEYATDKKADISFTAVYKNPSNGIKLEHSVDAKLRSWMAEDVLMSVLFTASPTSSLLSFNGQYGDERKVSSAIEYQRPSDQVHSLNIHVTLDESNIFQSTVNINLDGRKSVSVVIESGRRITLDVLMTPDGRALTVQFFWDRDVDLTKSFEFSGKYDDSSANALFKCGGKTPVRIEMEKVGRTVKALAAWRGSQVLLDMELEPTRMNGQLTTPFNGLEQILFDVQHRSSKSFLDSEIMVDWKKDRITLLMTGSRTSENVQGSAKLVSTFPSLESVGLNFQALTSQPVHRYVLAVQHLDRRAELSADYHRKGNSFSNGSIRLATPIRGYESFIASLEHNQEARGFQSDLKLEGPFASQIAVTLNGKRMNAESSGQLAVTTTFSALQASTVSYQLINYPLDRKLLVKGELNGQRAELDATVDLSDSKIQSKVRLTSPFADEITAGLQHSYQRRKDLNSQGHISWGGKSVQVNVNGHLVSSGQFNLSATAAAPGWACSARLDHFKSDKKMSTLLEAELNGQKTKWTLESQSFSPVLLETSLSLPYSGFEDLRLNLEHRRERSKTVTQLRAAKNEQMIVLEHTVEVEDAFNWANYLTVKTPFRGLASLDLKSRQTLTSSGQFQHGSQLQFNGEKMSVELAADGSGRNNQVTASGSFSSTWTENVMFELLHTDDGQEFRPILVFRSADGEPIRIETLYRRNPKNPSFSIDIASPLSQPIKFSASYVNAAPMQTAKVGLNWNGNQNIHWALDWVYAMPQSSIKTRLSTPFTDYSNLGGELTYDLTGPRKTGLAFIERGDRRVQLEAFAAGQGSTYQSEVVLSSPHWDTMKAVAIVDIANARASVRLEQGQKQIHLQGSLAVAATQTTVTAALETPINGWRSIRLDASLKSNRELQLDVDWDGEKVYVSGSYSSGSGKGFLRGNLKTPFIILSSAGVDASYDVSGKTKTASIKVSRNEHVIQASAQAVLVSPVVKVTFNLKAPCCGVNHLDFSGSYEESSEKKVGFVKLDLNGEKYQLDGHLLRSNGTAELALKSLTGYQGYEQVVLNAKYDLRKSTKTGMITFTKNSDRFHLSGAATLRNLLRAEAQLDLTTPIDPIKVVRLDGQYDLESGEKTVALNFIRNQVATRLTAAASLTDQLQGKVQYGLVTPIPGYETLRGEVIFDLQSTDKLIQVAGQTIKAEVEWNKRRFSLRSITPFTGFEAVNINGDYLLDDKELRSSLVLEKNENKMQFRFNGLFDLLKKEASFEFASPIPSLELLSSKAKWSLDHAKMLNVQAMRNDLTVELDMNGQFARDSSSLTLVSRSNIEDWRSASVSAGYDLRSSISGNLNLEKNGVQKAFAGLASLTGETAKVSIETPFEGLRTLGMMGRLANTKTTRTAALTLEKEGTTQDYSLELGFDANSATISIKTPMKNYEKMSAECQFKLDKPQKTFQLVLRKNQHQINLSGSVLASNVTGDAELKWSSTLVGFEEMTATVQYNFVGSKTVSGKFVRNGQTISVDATVDGLTLSAQLATPFTTLKQVTIQGDLNLDARTARLVIEHNGRRYEASGSFKGRELTIQLVTPVPGYEMVDLSSRWSATQLDVGLSSPALGKILLESEYNLEAKFARAVMTQGGIRYRNELVANIDDPWRQGDFLMAIQLPVTGYRNITTTLSYNLVEKTLLATLDSNSHRRYEAIARVTLTQDSAQAVAHVQTPLTGFEEIDFSAGYDLKSKTAFLISERNGQSIIFIQGTGAVSATSSNLSATFRAPSFTSQDIQFIAAYNLPYDFSSVDAKVKFLSHEILFDGKRDGWMSAMATLSTTFEHVQKAQIMWDEQKKAAAVHFNDMKVTIDGRLANESWETAGVTATLIVPIIGTHSLHTEWSGLPGKITSRATYENNQGGQIRADFLINYSGKGKAGEYELLFNTGSPKVNDIKVAGSWTCDKDVKVQTAIHWAGSKQIDVSFNGRLASLQTNAEIGLTAPAFVRPINLNVQYDFLLPEKSARLAYSFDSQDVLRFNGIFDVEAGKIDVVATAPQLHLMGKSKFNNEKKEALIHLESGQHITKFSATLTEESKEKKKLSASFSSPALGIKEWILTGDYDATDGLKTNANLRWAEDRTIKFIYHLSPTELLATLNTPFKGFEKTQLSSAFFFNGPKQTVDSSFLWAGKTYTVKAAWESSSETGLALNLRVTTPFQGFEEITLRANFLSGSDYSTTLTYTRAGQVIDIQGKLASNAVGSSAKITFTSADDFSALVEYDFQLPKKTASLTLNRGKQRVSISFAGEMNERLNGLVVVETSSTDPIRFSLDLDPVASEKTGRVTLEWGQQQKLELVGGLTSAKTGSKLRLTIQTPFEGFKKIIVSSKINPKAFDVSLDYGRSQKVQLNGQYRWEPSVYSVNGSLATPWIETLSWQTYVDLTSGFHGSSALKWAEKNFALTTIYRHSGSFVTAIETPYKVLSNAKVFANFELEKTKKLLALGGEYNGLKASLEGRLFLHGLNTRNSVVTGSWNHQAMTVETLYRNDGGLKIFGTNITTPFAGFERWSGHVELNSNGRAKNDFVIQLKTPLAVLPSADASLHAEYETGKRLEVNFSGAARGYQLGARTLIAKNAKSYTATLELDMPFLKSLNSATIRAECQLEGWKNIVTTVVAGIPSGEYTVKGSMLMGKSSLNLNAGIKTPAFAKSIEMGAGYSTGNDLSLIQGEIFVWDNRLEGRYEKRGNQITAELSANLPDLKVSHTRLNVDMNYRSARQVQATLTFTTKDQEHTVSLSYQSMIGSKFVGQVDIDSPLLQPKKSVSIKINYASLSSLNFEGKVIDGQSICDLTGSFQLSADSVQSQMKLNCPKMGEIDLQLAGNFNEGRLAVTVGSATHRMTYRINNSEGYDVNMSVESPFIQPVHLRGTWAMTKQRGQTSMTVRYGQSAHSILGDYLRTEDDKISASFNVASPYLPGGEASLQLKYHAMDLVAQLDVMGTFHRLSGQLEHWPNFNGHIKIDSPVLPWKTVALYSHLQHQNAHGQANITCVYGEKSLGLAGRLHFSHWSNFDASLELNTPFQALTLARADVQLSAVDLNQVNATVNFQSSHSRLPRATFNVQYQLSRTALDASATLNTPFNQWENLGLVMNIPLTATNSKVDGHVVINLPRTQYSVAGLLVLGQRQFRNEIEVNYGGHKFATRMIFKADEIYQAKIDVTTPIRGYENYSWDIKGQANVRHWGEAIAFLDWNGKRIEFSSNVKVEPLAYITVVQLSTPFVGFERYAIHLRLEGTERKTLQVEVESPGMRVGADFDYVFNSATNFVSKASIRTPLAGYESFTLHLSNQLGESSYAANAEAIFANYGMAATVEGLMRSNGFQAQVDGRYNDKVIVLKTAGGMDNKRISCNLELATPFERFRKVESFIQLEKNLAESKGFGVNVNGHQLVLVSLAQQPDGLRILQVRNPWRPIDLSYSWEHSVDLIHYHAQVCWDLNQRTTSTLGGRLIVRTSSYGRQISFQTIAPNRELSADYSLELTSTKIDHSASISWATNRSVGYKILAENSSNRRKTQLDGSIRLDFPFRSFQLEAHHAGGHEASNHIEFQWDAARDRTQRMGLRTEILDSRKVRMIAFHSALEHNVTLSGEYRDLQGKMELIYSPLIEHRMAIEGFTKDGTIYLSILHPVTNTDIRLEAGKTVNGGETQVSGRLDYVDRIKSSKFVQLGAKIHPLRKTLQLEGSTAENTFVMYNTMSVSGTSYGIISRASINNLEALTINGQVETSPYRPSVQVEANYAGGKSLNWYAGMPDRREVTLRATRDFHGRQITDGHFQLKLNRTDLLTSRLYWRSASKNELRDTMINSLVNILATCESFADNLASLSVNEWNDKRSSLAPIASQISERLGTSLRRELQSFRAEFQQMASEWIEMYEQNDLYLQDIVTVVRQVASMVQPYLEKTTKNIRVISQALIREGAAFYQAMSTTFTSLYEAASSAYQMVSVYVSSTATEAARRYSQLAGDVISRLLQLESSLVQTFQYLQSIYTKYAGQLETVVMEKVEDIRRQAIELANNYAKNFQPYLEYFDTWIERSRTYFATMTKSIQDWQEMVYEELMTYVPFQRMHAVYLEYATWLEEFHLQDYIDQTIAYFNRVKQEVKDRFNALTARYQPLIEPLVQAIQGRLDALKQMPLFAYMTKTADRMYQQLAEFTKYVEIEAQLRQVLREILRHTDQLMTQLVGDLKGSLDFPWRPVVLLDWTSGRVEYSQKLPFTWEDFSQLPRLREMPLIRKIATAKRNLLRDMDYSQFYFSAMNILATYRPMRIQSILPPFGSHAFVAGTQHYMTFDQRYYEFAGECSYLLVNDFFRNEFSAVVNYEGANSKVTRKSLTILSDGRQIEIDSSFRVTVNGRKVEMPLIYDGTSIHRDGQRILINNNRGYRVDCNLYRDICSVHVSGWSFGKTGGLFGVYNNEPADDFITPFRQLRKEDEVDSFANSWKVGTARCRVRNFAMTRPAPSQRNSRLCDQIFNAEKSVLRPCYQMVDPTPYHRMCLNDLAGLENSPKRELGVCTAAAAYANECRLAGLDLFVPPQCVRCELEDGQVMGSGEVKTFQNNAPKSADVVFIIEQKSCLNGTRLSYLPTAIDAALRERGIQNNRFAVVGFGGRGQLLSQPHVRTSDGQIWSNRKSVQTAMEDLPLNDDTQPGDIHAALRYAVNLSYRAGVSKQFVLISCGRDCSASSYADTLTLLIENDIRLHLLQPRDLIVKGRNSSEELKNIFGFDAEEVYTVRNVRSLKGDRELRRQLAIPKDFCTPLALETNGTLFDLKKMMPGQQQQQQAKKFVDIFTRRVAATGDPSPCQRCDCIGDRDGIGSILCQRCVSPVLERLDKVWEQLIYENELENKSNIEEVSVAQMKASVLETPGKALNSSTHLKPSKVKQEP